MAVPKTTQTRYTCIWMQGNTEDNTSNPIPTSFLFEWNVYLKLCCEITGNSSVWITKMRCRDGVACVVLCVACTLWQCHPYVKFVWFGTAIPTSLYI